MFNTASNENNTLGLGYLTGVLSATVNRVTNQYATLTVNYAKDGNLANELREGMVIQCSMGYKDREKKQKFRISEIVKAQDQITITANHISGDLAYNVLAKSISIANASPTTAFNAIKDALADPMPMLTFESNINKVANLGWNLKDLAELNDILLNADQAQDTPVNSMVALYGGQVDFDNYHMIFNNKIGKNTGIIIKYGQNMESISRDENTNDTYNAIFPFATYTPNEVPIDGDGSQDYNGQGTVQYVGTGGASTYNTPFKGHTVSGHVQNGTYYHVTKTATENTVNGDTWYMIGENQWIDQHFFTFDKSGNYVVNKIKGQGTISIGDNGSEATGLIVVYSGIGTVEYSGAGKVLLWNSPFSGRTGINQYVSNGSRWKITRKATDENGVVWYDLGVNQWITSQYFSVSKTGDYATTPSHGILQVTGAVTSMTGPGVGSNANWKPANGTRWKVSQSAQDGAGNTWYKVSTYIWVQAGDTVVFNTSGTVVDNPEAENLAIAKTTGQVPIYSQPNGTKVTNNYVKVGQQYVITAQSESNGKTWYEIGENQWVDASYFNFDKNTDVAPDEGKGANEESEVEDVTVILPDNNGVLIAPNAAGSERLRIQPVDLSEYNVRDANKLREVAESYMREYRIGYPNVSLTVSYRQMQGDYSKLTEVDLYDTVSIQFDQLGIAETAQVNSVTWNVLTEHYDTITIGELPITYEHALGNYIDNKVTKQTSAVEKKATHLFGEMHNAVKLEGDDRKAAMIKIGEELGLVKQSYTQDYQKFDQAISNINSEIEGIQQFINGGSNAPIQAYPNWQNPTELRAVNGDGSYMRFNSHGLGYVGTDGVLRSGMDGLGHIAGEDIVGGTIKSIKLESVDIIGDSTIHSNGYYSTVMSGSNGISIDDQNGNHMGLTATQLVLPQNGTISIGDSTLYYAPNGFNGRGIYIHRSNGDH